MQNIDTGSDGPPARSSKGNPGFKNLAAFHELLTRDGMCCPALNSKFANKESLSAMFTGKIFRLRQEDVIYRECVKPPTKLVLVQKFLKYLGVTGAQSGIVMKNENFPDKRWLILAIATLSQGRDEIFAADYMPSKPLSKVVQEQLDQPIFQNIPAHLQAKGKNRAMRFTALNKEERMEQKLREADLRLQKQVEAKKKLVEAIDVMKSGNKEEIKWMQERERIRSEVTANL